MVLVIAAIVVAGVTAAFALRVDNGDGLGSQYRIQKLKDNAVITPGQEDNVCTVTIVCDTILDNIGKLNKEKAPFVPKDAVILPQTRVSFAPGDTVFDVLQKVCTAADDHHRKRCVWVLLCQRVIAVSVCLYQLGEPWNLKQYRGSLIKIVL